jgi:hypothetical protein
LHIRNKHNGGRKSERKLAKEELAFCLKNGIKEVKLKVNLPDKERHEVEAECDCSVHDTAECVSLDGCNDNCGDLKELEEETERRKERRECGRKRRSTSLERGLGF